MHQFPQPWVFHNPLSLSQQKARGFWRMKHARTYSDDPAAARRVACFARQRGGGGATSWPRCRGPCWALLQRLAAVRGRLSLRSDERRVGKEGASRGKSRCHPVHKKKK